MFIYGFFVAIVMYFINVSTKFCEYLLVSPEFAMFAKHGHIL